MRGLQTRSAVSNSRCVLLLITGEEWENQLRSVTLGCLNYGLASFGNSQETVVPERAVELETNAWLAGEMWAGREKSGNNYRYAEGRREGRVT